MLDSQVEAAPAPRSLGKRALLAVLLAICVFAVLSVAGDVRALGQNLTRFRLSALGAALGLVLCNYGLRFVRWQYYLKVLGVRGVETWLSGLVFLAGFVMSVTPGKMGEVFKSYLLHQYRGVPVTRTVSAVITERLLDLVALVALVGWAGESFPDGRWVAALGGMLVASIVAVSLFRPFGLWLLAQLDRWPRLSPLVERLRGAYDALNELTRPRPFAVGTALAIAGWSLECVATLAIVRGFGDELMSLAGAAYAYSAATLAGALAMLPGGLGVAEIGMSGLFRVVNPQLSLSSAAAATILVRLCTLWFGVALGGVALTLLRGFADAHTEERSE